MSANPHANGGLLLRTCGCPTSATTPSRSRARARSTAEATRLQGQYLRDVMRLNLDQQNFRLFSPDENNSNRWQDVLEVTNRCYMAEILPEDDHLSPDGRVMEVLSRAPVPGLAGGLPADRPARLLQLLRGLHPHHRLDVQPARQVAEGVQPHPVAAADRLAQLPAQLARLAPGPQRLQPPGPGLHRPRGQQEGRGDPRLPAARREHAAVGHRSVPAQPQLRERRRRRQAAGAAVADDGPGDQALHRRHRHLGLGQQRPGQRAGRGDGLLRRRARRWRRWRPCS